MGQRKLAIADGLILRGPDLMGAPLKRFAIGLQLHALSLDCVTLDRQLLILDLPLKFALTLTCLAVFFLKLSDPLRDGRIRLFTCNGRPRQKRCGNDEIGEFHRTWIFKSSDSFMERSRLKIHLRISKSWHIKNYLGLARPRIGHLPASHLGR